MRLHSKLDGPFGVTMGTPTDSYKSCQPAENPGFYRCSTLPRTHPDMQAYAIEGWPETGACFVKGISSPISADVYGTTLRGKADEIAAQIRETYGNAEKTDFLMTGSIWKDPRDWSMALLKKERFYFYKWDGGTGANLRDGIKSIVVAAAPISSDKGYISVEFTFQNYTGCENAERKAKANAF